jgi:hypothetical protein
MKAMYAAEILLSYNEMQNKGKVLKTRKRNPGFLTGESDYDKVCANSFIYVAGIFRVSYLLTSVGSGM